MNNTRTICLAGFIFFLSLITGCTDISKEKYYLKGRLVYNSSTHQPYTGIIKDDLIMVEYRVVEGLKDGFFKSFYDNGKLKINGNIKNNEYEGEWTYYYKNGQIESHGLFKNDKASGKWNWYYKNGMIKESGYFRNGKKIGEWFTFGRNGEITDQSHFVRGKKTSIFMFKNI